MEPITQPPRSRRLLRALITTAVIGGLAVGAWFGIAYWRKPPPTTHTTSEASRGDVVSAATASGTLSPVVQVDVGSQVSGRITELLVDYNDQVKAGQVIARIDPQQFVSAVQQAQARLGSAKADLSRTQAVASNAKTQHARLKALVVDGAVAQADVDAAYADWKSAESQVISARAGITEAQASLAQAKTNLTYTTISSPIDGIVIARSVDVGQTVAASLSAPTLFVIAGDLRQMEVHTSVAESDVGQLVEGMKGEFSVDAFPEKTFTGTVKQVRFEATNVSNVVTYDAVVDVRNDALELRPGMTANVTFVIQEQRDVLVVPTKALRYRPATARRSRGAEKAPRRKRSEAVWVLRDGVPVRVEIETGLSDGTISQVVAGELAEGDLVITGDSTTAATAKPASNTGRGGPPRGAF